MHAPQTPPKQVYGDRCAVFAARRDVYQHRSNLNGNISLLLFVAAGACLAFGLWRQAAVLYGAAGVLVLAFIVSLVHHDRVNGWLRRYAMLYKINHEGLQRLERAWADLPLAGWSRPEGDKGAGLDPSTAGDLDLFGHASLEHLLGTPTTPAGQAALRRWILYPAVPDTVRHRQAAVDELAAQIDWRDEVCLRGRLMGPVQADYERLIAWAEQPGWLHARPWLVWLARGLAVATVGLIVVQARGVTVYPAIAALLLVDAALLLTAGRRVSHDIDEVAERQNVFHAYADMFELITGHSFTSPGLAGLQTQLKAGTLTADRQVRRLARLMPLAEIRRWMFFFVIDIPTLWSFHTLWLLESWRETAGAHVRGWLAALGEVEALIALATLCYDHPAWSFPELEEDVEPMLAAQQLAHPLLPPSRAVGNDVQVGPPGTFLLVTGSNMSGKSTLLRAIGLNTVLAQMGGPVCAAQMRLTPLVVASSMRVQDSLEQGVSTFMAELRRLKAIVDLADAPRDCPVLFLLDEILQGTNTAERQVAARRIIAHLIHSGAIGAVSTHDLALADGPEIARASVPVYFTESFTRGAAGPTMTFDYRLRPGIATSTNALKLMALVGLPVDPDVWGQI